MTPTSEILSRQATALFDEMHQIFERSSIQCHYPQEFYHAAREHLAATFSAGAKYLWIIRPNGVDLGRFDVLPSRTSFVSAALKHCQAETHPANIEIRHISVTEAGEHVISGLITAEAAGQMLKASDARPRFQRAGSLLRDKEMDAAQLHPILSPITSPNRTFIAHVDSRGNRLTHAQALAAFMHCEDMATQQSDLFTRCTGRFYDGNPFQELFAQANIEPVEPGAYALRERERIRA